MGRPIESLHGMNVKYSKRRRSFHLAIAFLVGITLAWIWLFVSNARVFRSESAAPIVIVDRNKGFDPSVADPDYDPEAVVKLQLSSLKATAKDPSQLVICFSLASPSNRLVTGPIEHFLEIISSNSYRPLIGHKIAMVGRADIQGPHASVMATVISQSGQTHAFQFRLSRITKSGELAADLENATGNPADEATDNPAGSLSKKAGLYWMTTGVSPLSLVPPQEKDASKQSDDNNVDEASVLAPANVLVLM